ncbi:probable helicase MAGATAMA 3 [Argentina anserina]|uniref:probable helicase MAGATAMA 3 n=1 Tax=Argentina anserina TaxID=57926 RepID=UPI0021762CCD|nr:probable helicase MAGATAMA 3 [Potentilla anserina]
MTVEIERLRSQEADCIARFHKIVLTWDFLRIVQETQRRNKEKGEEERWESLGITKVKDRYTDVDDYISTYEPLLFEEIKSEIASNKDRLGAGKDTLVKKWVEKDGGFIIATLCVDMDEGDDDHKKVKPNDLFLLSKKVWSKSTVSDETSYKKICICIGGKSR